MWHYMLNPDRSITRTRDMMRWATWFEAADRTVARTKLIDGSEVSTVFLGLDHGFGRRKPVLFETAFFADPATVEPSEAFGRTFRRCEILDRYSTWAEPSWATWRPWSALPPRWGS